MKTLTILCATALLGVLGVLAAPVANAQSVRSSASYLPVASSLWQASGRHGGQVIRCRSENYQQAFCRVDARGGVTLVRQHSRASCVEGRSWGVGRDGIWVDRGCDADFAINAGYQGPGHGGSVGVGQTFRCRSEAFRYAHCRTDVRGGVHLVRQISRTQCVEGRNWGVDRNGVWVDQGCDAEFRSVSSGRPGGGPGWGGPGWGGPPSTGGTFRCRSEAYRYNHCATDPRHGVRLVRQISSAACVRGQTWGTDRNGVWVDRGCDAEFALGRR